MVDPPAWLADPRLARSRHLTADVHKAALWLQARQPIPSDREPTEHALRIQWQTLHGRPPTQEEWGRALGQLDVEWALRDGDIFAPLEERMREGDVPPVLFSVHSGGLIPMLMPVADGGQLVLVDRSVWQLWHGVFAAALNWAYLDRSAAEKTEFLDFILSTGGTYAMDPGLRTQRMKHPSWINWYSRMALLDQDLGVLADGLATNVMAWGVYHECSHALLGHAGRQGRMALYGDAGQSEAPALHWQVEAEFEADQLGFELFLDLVGMRYDLRQLATGAQVDRAPISFFRLLDAVYRLRERIAGARPLANTHPVPLQRKQRLLDRHAGRLSAEGAALDEGIAAACEAVAARIQAADRIELVDFVDRSGATGL